MKHLSQLIHNFNKNNPQKPIVGSKLIDADLSCLFLAIKSTNNLFILSLKSLHILVKTLTIKSFTEPKKILPRLEQSILNCWLPGLNDNIISKMVYCCRTKIYLKRNANQKLQSNDLFYI